MGRRCFWGLFCAVLTLSGLGDDRCVSPGDRSPLHAIQGEVPCRSAAEPGTRRLFACPDRLLILTEAGIAPGDISTYFDLTQEEHAMVKAAIDRVVAAKHLKPLQRAVYWEEMAAHIQRKIGHPISQGFRGHLDGEEIYIFQGTQRFDDQVYVLVFVADGRLFTGRVPPVGDIASWTGRLSELREI